MRDFSNSLLNQVGILKGEKELTNVFIECYMAMLLDKRKIANLQIEIDKALDNRDKTAFFILTGKLKQIEKEMLAFS